MDIKKGKKTEMMAIEVVMVEAIMEGCAGVMYGFGIIIQQQYLSTLTLFIPDR